jgi:cationic peptide transport system permease protein
VILLLITLFGPLVVPYGIDEQHSARLLLALLGQQRQHRLFPRYRRSGARHPLPAGGGARFTFGNALLVVVIAMVAGTAIGILGGMSKGLKSSVLHHLLDTLLSIPSLLLAIIMVAILGPGLFNTLIAITLALIPPSSGPPTTRSTPRCRRSTSSPAGSTALPPRIMRLAILPNIVETLVAQTTPHLSAAILDISAVGFLGLGAQSPNRNGAPCWPTRAISSISPPGP